MNISEFAISRQKVLLGAGLGLVTAVVAACSSSGNKPEATSESSASPAATPASGAAAAPAASVIAKTADVPVGSGVIVDKVVVTQPTAGVFKGFSSTCTHAGCTLNKVADGTIDCPCHGSKFNLDGSVANGPAKQPLEAENITVQGDSIMLG